MLTEFFDTAITEFFDTALTEFFDTAITEFFDTAITEFFDTVLTEYLNKLTANKMYIVNRMFRNLCSWLLFSEIYAMYYSLLIEYVSALLSELLWHCMHCR